MQAEFQSYYYCIATLLFMKHLFEEIGMPYEPEVVLFTDAEAAQKATMNPELSQRTKHFETKVCWVRSFVRSVGIKPSSRCSTSEPLGWSRTCRPR
jgi:hypothetical protein